MPISEDEYDHHGGQSHAMSKAEQRRSNKPIMEKRRRARINHCLNELKSLILDAMKKDPARHSKLEKADILEMTVKHLQSVQRQQLAVAVATDPAVLHKFKTGFNECAGEVSRYIGRLDGVEAAVKQRLVSHLAHCVSGLQQLTPLAFTAAVQPPPPPPPVPTAATAVPAAAAVTPTPTGVASAAGDVNNNRGTLGAGGGGGGGGSLPTGLQLIPSRLPTGEFALLLPGGGNLQGLPFFPAPPPPVGSTASAATPTLIDRSHPSAFTSVDRSRRNTPPPPSSLSNYPSNPPLSPTSSVSSGDDCSLTSEPYLSSSSPPPPPPPPTDSFKFPPVAHTDSSKSVTSVGVGTVTEVKVEFKTIPVHGPFPMMTSSPTAVATTVTSSSSIHQPLTVITSQPPPPPFKTTSAVASAQTEATLVFSGPTSRDALDFSIKREEPSVHHLKKEDPPLLQSTSTQTTSSMGIKRSLPASFGAPNHTDEPSSYDFQPPRKMPRYSLHLKDSDVAVPQQSSIITEPTSQVTGGNLLKIATPKHFFAPVGEDLSHKTQQSSSSSESEANTSTTTDESESSQAGSNKDMWRPW